MVPLATLATVQPIWVQMALKALNSPALGWVTTVFVASKTLPPPTGMSAALIASFGEPAAPVALPAALPVEVAVAPPPPHAARVTAPTTPAPRTPALWMTLRRSTPCARGWSGQRAGGWLLRSSECVAGAALRGWLRQRNRGTDGSPGERINAVEGHTDRPTFQISNDPATQSSRTCQMTLRWRYCSPARGIRGPPGLRGRSPIRRNRASAVSYTHLR